MPDPVLYDIVDGMAAFRQGNEKAFDLFFSRYYAPVAMFTFRITRNRDVAEEAAADAFLKLWQRCQTFSTESALRSFLYTVARNSAIDWLRKEKTKLNAAKEWSETELVSDNDAFRGQVAAETYVRLYKAIGALPPRCRTIFKMLLVDKMNYQQVAAALNISVNTVRVQKTRAIELLRAKLAATLLLLITIFFR